MDWECLHVLGQRILAEGALVIRFQLRRVNQMTLLALGMKVRRIIVLLEITLVFLRAHRHDVYVGSVRVGEGDSQIVPVANTGLLRR